MAAAVFDSKVGSSHIKPPIIYSNVWPQINDDKFCHIQRFRASLRRNGNGFVVTTFNWQLAAMQHLLRHQKCGIIK